ncbi:MAG: ATP-binding cassette domain-containing protein [Sphingomonadales bacterium]|nr:ATP-binding cassette domain-containing protein [Sphingomonadales bacterium]MDE2570488.1 ATP-binding cassette domain-containing protein [Sphingomonadales bacterium]
MSVLEASDLTVPDRLHGVSAALRPGEVTAICGPNGAGKSTLLACLAGLLAPAAGEVRLDDAPLAALRPRERARAIGFLPQDGEVAWDLTVEALVALGRLPWAAPAAENRAAVAQALATLDLSRLAKRQVSTLSGGERARVLLARVLAGSPRWLLADEPLASLDLAHQLALAGHLRAQAAGGAGVVLVVHDLALAMNHASRVLVLSNGALAADGPPEQALAEEVIARVWSVRARWLGEPGARALVAG